MYSKKPISHNAKPSSDAPQTKQTKHLIRSIVRHSSAECVCVPMWARCVVNSAHKTDTKIPEERATMSHRQVNLIFKTETSSFPK